MMCLILLYDSYLCVQIISLSNDKGNESRSSLAKIDKVVVVFSNS